MWHFHNWDTVLILISGVVVLVATVWLDPDANTDLFSDAAEDLWPDDDDLGLEVGDEWDE